MKLTKLITLLYLCFIAFQLNAQNRATGLVFDDVSYKKTDILGLGFNFSADTTTKKSLKKYCPTPKDQGNTASCVGWSAAYAAFTIAKAEKDNITEQTEIDAIAFSPHYVYNQIKLAGCLGGSKFTDALAFLNEEGVCTLKDFDTENCEEIPSKDLATVAQNNKIKNYGAIFKLEDTGVRKVEATINSLNAKKPVVIGISITESLIDLHSKTWQPKANEATMGGHAVTVVGFDKNTKTFEIINSWGTEWGKQGFFEVSFETFKKYVKYGYQITLDEKTNPTASIQLNGNFSFKKYVDFDSKTNSYIFKAVKPIFQGTSYIIPDGEVSLGDFFQLEAKNIKKDSYVYVFSLKPDGSTEILFPETDIFVDKYTKNKLPKPQNSMAFANNMTVNIPKSKDEGLETDQQGEDILCILYSYYEIPDIHAKVNLIKNEVSDNFQSKLSNAFSTDLVAESDIKYSPDNMSVQVNTSSGTIVPIILKVNVK